MKNPCVVWKKSCRSRPPLFRRAAQFWYELENEKNQLSELIATADPRAQAEALIQEACKLAERYGRVRRWP